MAIKELFYDNRPQVLLDPKASQRIDSRFKFTRNGTATYVDRDGIVKTAAVDQPRFGNDQDSGLLLEASTTNLVTNSDSNPLPRTSIDFTVTTANIVTPRGEIGPVAACYIYRAVGYGSRIPLPTQPNDVYTLSLWARADTGTLSVTLDVSDQGLKSFTVTTEWTRISTSSTTPSTNIFGDIDCNSVDRTLYIWGVQIERGPVATSYVPTGGAAVTRAADLLSVESPLPATGSVYIDARATKAEEDDTLLSIKNSSNDKIDLGFFSNAATYNSVALIANYDGTSKSSLPLPVPTTDRERNIITYGSQNYQYGSNTARFATSLSSSVPTDLNKLSIGHDSVDPTKAFNGYLNSVYLWSGELTPAVAEALVRSELDPIDADTFVPTGPAGSLSIVINTQGAAADGDKVFELPAESVANDNDIVITWGDQTESGLEGAAAELGAPGLTKTYTAAGIYSIFVEGQLENLQFNNSSSAPDLLQIVRWGTTANGNDVFLSPSTMANAFYGCSQLDFSSVARTTSLPDTSAVANWTQAFYNCSSITGIFPQFNFSGATSFVRAWAGCSSITSFTAAGGQPQNVTQFFRAWDGCSGLTSFPLIDTSSGLSFNSAWQNCSSLTSFPAINTAASVGFNSTWRNCSSLTSFPLINTAFGIDFGFAWGGCSSLTSFPLINTSAGESFIGTWSNCSSLTSFPLINTSSGTSFASAWLGCSSLTSFPLIDTSNGTSFNSAWRDCIGLASFPLLNTSSGTDFARAWYVCVSLASFPAINTSAGTNFGQTWYANTSLTAFPSLDFDSATGSASDASTVLSGFYGAWLSCSNLANFPANLFNNTTCTRYLQAFQGCALTAASIENILVSINTANTSNGNLSLEGGTNAAQSTWTTAATNAYNALVGRGWTITFNP